jgi:hypothetical protein
MVLNGALTVSSWQGMHNAKLPDRVRAVEEVAEERIKHTQPMIFSADETADVGIGLGTPVVEAIGSEGRSRFTGHVRKVTIEVK